MLTALEEGVKGGKWFSLIDKVYRRTEPDGGVRAGRGQRGSRRGGPRHGRRCSRTDLDENLKRLSERAAERDATGRRRSAGTTSPNRGARRSGRWGFRRCATGWCRRRCGCAGADLRAGLRRRTATASAPDGAARTRCGGWMSCSRPVRVRRGRRSEELLRHDPARPPDGAWSAEGGGRAGAEPDRSVPEAGHSGRPAGVDARTRARRKGR